MEKKSFRIGLLGASFDTGNLGVSALAESSIKVVLNRWPNAEILLLGTGYMPSRQYRHIMGKEVCIKTLPIRFSKNIFLSYHFMWFALYTLLVRILTKSRLKDSLIKRNSPIDL